MESTDLKLNPKNQRKTMKKRQLRHRATKIAALCSCIAVFSSNASARADAPPSIDAVGQNAIGPSVKFGNSQTAIGVDSQFRIDDNISVRPFIYFPNGSTNFGSALTYDFKARNHTNRMQITPFVGGSVDISNGGGSSFTTIGVTGGADFDITDNIRLKAGLNVPLSTGAGQTSSVVIGAGYRF
jgi:opacity protein-like surface antigen